MAAEQGWGTRSRRGFLCGSWGPPGPGCSPRSAPWGPGAFAEGRVRGSPRAGGALPCGGAPESGGSRSWASRAENGLTAAGSREPGASEGPAARPVGPERLRRQGPRRRARGESGHRVPGTRGRGRRRRGAAGSGRGVRRGGRGRAGEGGARCVGPAPAASLRPGVAASGRKQQHICGSH